MTYMFCFIIAKKHPPKRVERGRISRSETESGIAFPVVACGERPDSLCYPATRNTQAARRLSSRTLSPPGEQLQIGDDIVVEVLEISGAQVRLGITAPREVAVLRDELLDEPSEWPNFNLVRRAMRAAGDRDIALSATSV